MKQFIQRHIVLPGIVFIGALASLGFVACTSDDDVLNRLDEKVTADSNPRLRTEAEAIEIAIGNLGMIDRAVPRSRAASDIVADVSVIGSKVKSRNGATNDTLLYAVNFKNNRGSLSSRHREKQIRCSPSVRKATILPAVKSSTRGSAST